jgi:hypothetical protein
MFLGCTVVSTVTRAKSFVQTRRSRVPPANSRPAGVELFAKPLAPMAQVRALVRKLVLEEFLAGEVLEIQIIGPALAHRFVGQARRDLAIEKVVRELRSSRARNRSPDPVVSCFFGRMLPSAAATESRLPIRGNPKNEIASFRGLEPQKLAISNQQIG